MPLSFCGRWNSKVAPPVPLSMSWRCDYDGIVTPWVRLGYIRFLFSRRKRTTWWS